MPTQTDLIVERYDGTNDEPGVFEALLLKEHADRCLDCGYWTLLQWLNDGYCVHCDVPEVEEEW